MSKRLKKKVDVFLSLPPTSFSGHRDGRLGGGEKMVSIRVQ